MSEDKKKVVGIASYETRRLVDRLKQLVASENYDVVPYQELSGLIGFDVQKEGRYYLTSARKAAEEETGRLFGVVPKQGVKLLAIEEQASVAPNGTRKAGRVVKTTAIRMARVQYDKLNEEQRHRHHVFGSIIGAMALFTNKKAIVKVGTAVQQRTDRLAVDETLKLFGS